MTHPDTPDPHDYDRIFLEPVAPEPVDEPEEDDDR